MAQFFPKFSPTMGARLFRRVRRCDDNGRLPSAGICNNLDLSGSPGLYSIGHAAFIESLHEGKACGRCRIGIAF